MTRPAPSALNILLVDDEPSVLSLLADQLRCDGHEVTPSENGQTALALFTAQKFDLLITDRMMPSMDGEMLAAEVKRRSPTTPVILISGMPPPGGCPAADAILAKPFSHSLLAATIARCLPASPPRPGKRSSATGAASDNRQDEEKK